MAERPYYVYFDDGELELMKVPVLVPEGATLTLSELIRRGIERAGTPLTEDQYVMLKTEHYLLNRKEAAR